MVGLWLVAVSVTACNDRGTETEMNSVNRTDTRRNTTETKNTLESDSASPHRDSAQHGGPDKPVQ